MVRTYQRKFSNSRNGKNHSPYLSYCKEDLQTAINEVQSGSLKLIEAANKYKIPKSTLSRKCRNINCTQEKAGHPTLFSKDEEKSFIKYIQILSNWGFPLDSTDLRVFAQKYLNKIGKTVYNLKDNMPGVDWARNFMIRHKSEISNRNASNITSDRAKISPTVRDDFFLHYENTIKDVSPDCIINYDETNLTDDPGHKKYLFKRGCKYPERVINTTKTSISLMFTGTADGHLLPTYVVYKADHLWDQWLEGGPEGTRYNRSKSGWFDSACFEDWFNTVIVPYAKTKTGRKVIIGDNLSSHFSESVLQTCQELNIMFVCLPPKTTHLLQPLDVAFYAPLKKYWRDVLTHWKRTEGLKHKTLVKSSFPKLLCRLQNKLREKGSESNNIIAGFNKCGLYPVNSERPKSRLPHTNSISEELIEDTASSAVIEILTNLRNPTVVLEQPKRKRKCNVPPGKSITADDLLRVEKSAVIKSRQGKKIIKRCSEKIRTSSNARDRNNIDYNTKETNMQPIAGPSGQCKLTTFRKENSGNESDSTYLSSEDEYPTKNKNKPLKPISSFKGKGKGKKSKIQAHNTDTKKKVDSQIIQSLNCKTAVPKSRRKITTRKLSISTTSVSDTRSVHSDSDLLEVDFDDHSSVINNNNNDLSPLIMPKTDNSDKIENQRKITDIEQDEKEETKSCITNFIIKGGTSQQYSEINAIPSMAEIRNDFDDKENGEKDKARSEMNEETQTKLCDNEYSEVPLIFFDEFGSEEIVVGDDNNSVSLISFNEKELYSKDIMNNKECSEVMDNVENADMIENKENHFEIGKKLSIIKEEKFENALKNKKVVFKDLKPVCLSSYIEIPKKNKQKPIKYRKNYYNDKQILKALMDSD